ncbi:DUF427 domain-containing protein [Rhodovulum sp. ES.010]|uniref:DUF427 domain-containing protein n=1 Tax=Rhodovulum sp. ES.010 TaxID=1882821 RepID=UPI001C37D6C2|nr:DUF427 domain-containing protein [Rhodovulum sp. ES.010]
MALPLENVQDYPRPPVLEPAGARLRVVFGGSTIVDSARGLRVLETHHAPTYYIPAGDVAEGALVPCAGRSFCEWKGRASYFDVSAGGRVAHKAAWTYPAPHPRFAALADHVAFYAGQMEACFVGGEEVIPQPGDVYGGWVTANLEGIVKGGPGTWGW